MMDPDDPAALADYYRDIYAKLLPQGRSDTADLVQRSREELAFASTAGSFRMIDDGGIPVIVEWDDPQGLAADLVHRLDKGQQISAEDWRFLQGRSATLPTATVKIAVGAGTARNVRGGPDDEGSSPLVWWNGKYDAARGVDPQALTEAKDVIW
jgi:hypothetical protein